MRVNKGAAVYILPCIAGHVGADAAAMILSEEPHQMDEVCSSLTLVPTLKSSSATANVCSRARVRPPAEGAQISCGQRAAPGAIERVRIDPESFEGRFSVIGSELWSDDDGFEEAIAAFGVTGICGSGIIEVVAEMYLAGIITEDGVIDGSLAEKSSRIIPNDRTFSYLLHDGEQRIVVTQNDVRQIQLPRPLCMPASSCSWTTLA